MLTLNSNFKSLEDRKNEECTEQDLIRLSRGLFENDVVNFGLDKVGGGFPSKVAEIVLQKVRRHCDAIFSSTLPVLLINDYSLVMLHKLITAGKPLNQIYLAFGSWEQGKKNKVTISDNTIVFNNMKNFLRVNFNEAFNIISLGEVFMAGKSWGLIIANPPYGSIGANITKKIIDTVDFKEYVNLLPANDYKRNDSKDLYNYQSDMEPVKDGFADAAVTTHIALIHKDKANGMTLEEFERSQYIDPQLDKYFADNYKRYHYAINNPKELHRVSNPDISKIIFIAHRDINHKHFPYDKEAQANFINLNLGDYKTVCDRFVMKSAKENGKVYFLGNCYVFNSSIEKTNLSKFIYSINGFRFISKVFTAMNIDGRQTIKNVMPKVDWTRSWTVEEILKDYGYTDEEVQAVMDDLKNFKGMDN